MSDEARQDARKAKKNMETRIAQNFSIVLALYLLLPGSAYSDDAFFDAVQNGEFSLQLRLSLEHSDFEDAADLDPATGLNLRTRLGYRTGDFRSSNFFVQVHNLANLIEEFDDTNGGGDAGRDKIGDPDGARIHQTYFEFNGISGTQLRLGRQEIVLDDARLIGNVNWRQNGQSFDALSVTNQSIERLTLYAGVISEVNTIVLSGIDLDHLVLVNARYTYTEGHDIALFSYLLDVENDAINRDSATYGGRVKGACGEYLKYDLTYAFQNDYEEGNNNKGDMVNAFLGVNRKWFSVGAGYSRISGQDGSDNPFDTLFSTAHKFNGWADQFLTTNGGNLAGGLEDLFFQLGTDIAGTKIVLRYHMFDTTEHEPGIHDRDYGDEFDFDVQRKLRENLTAQFRFAHYNETNNNGGLNPTTDEEVFWARLNYSF
jgi:hypothetical protein